MSKEKAIGLHRAALQAIRAAGAETLLTRKQWGSYLARAGNVGSPTQVDNINWRLEMLGLIKSHGKEGVEILESGYEDILLAV